MSIEISTVLWLCCEVFSNLSCWNIRRVLAVTVINTVSGEVNLYDDEFKYISHTSLQSEQYASWKQYVVFYNFI